MTDARAAHASIRAALDALAGVPAAQHEAAADMAAAIVRGLNHPSDEAAHAVRQWAINASPEHMPGDAMELVDDINRRTGLRHTFAVGDKDRNQHWAVVMCMLTNKRVSILVKPDGDAVVQAGDVNGFYEQVWAGRWPGAEAS